MKRRGDLVLGLLLAIPIVGFVAAVAQREYLLANAPVLNVAIRGVDPRDLLRGRYLVGDFEWEWDPAAIPTERHDGYGQLCVTPSAGTAPGRRKVRFFAAAQEPPRGTCLAILNGRFTPASGAMPARFMPDGVALDHGDRLRLYVPERQAGRLEELLARRSGAVSVDIVLRPDATAAIATLRVDGEPLGK